jgi:hypothetical protein
MEVDQSSSRFDKVELNKPATYWHMMKKSRAASMAKL